MTRNLPTPIRCLCGSEPRCPFHAAVGVDLSSEIAEMFAGFDGYDRYWQAVAIRCDDALDRKRKYNLEYSRDPFVRAARREYRKDPRVRAMRRLTGQIYDRDPERRRSKSTRLKLKWQTDPAWREHVRKYKRERSYAKHGVTPTQYGPIQAKHGTTTGYLRGCRCRQCTDASTAYKREYLARKRSLDATSIKQPPARAA